MREMSHAVVELLVDLLGDPRSRRVNTSATGAEMRARVEGPWSEEGRGFENVLDKLRSDVLCYTSDLAHPRYFAFIPGSPTFPGALGDLLASALNIEASSWLDAAGPSQLELTVLDWFRQWLGYPPGAGGVLVSGGSAANLGALACAREALVGPMRDDLVIYAADQSHSSIARAARTLGFRPDQLRVLPVDDEFRMRPDALAGAMRADREAGRAPLIVCAAAGSTNTGAVDPLPDIERVCRANDCWLHVDAAYGGFSILTERGRRWLDGIELADSVTLDPHKWLYQPFECGCLMVRDEGLLEAAFRISPDYLKDARSGEVSFGDRNLQLSRMTRALKLWLSLETFGVAAFRAAIDRTLDIASFAEHRVAESEELELLRPARLGIVCFRRRFGSGRSEAELDELNRLLIAALGSSGVGLLSSTRLRGRYSMRLCVLNHTSSETDVETVLGWLERAHVDPEGPSIAAHDQDGTGSARDQSLVMAGEADGEVGPETLQALEALDGLDADQLDLVASSGRVAEVDTDESIVTRWGGGRDFFLILDGTLRADVDGETVRTMGPGDFFGELAALDWGAGYGYTRLATVIATSPARLLAVPPDVFNRLVGEVPAFGRRIMDAVRERLPRT